MAAPPRPRGIVRMKCCAGMALLIPGSLGNGRDRDTLRPVRQSRAAATRFAGVIRLIVPRWSSGPHRPQLLRSRIQLRTSASVGSRRSVIAPSPCLSVVGAGARGARLPPPSGRSCAATWNFTRSMR